MATYGVETVVQFVAWDTAANAGKTGDVANFTLRWVKDGTSAAPTNSPAEVDATNAPGVYKITLTAAETQAVCGTLGGKSATAGVVIIPVTLTFSRLPNAAPGANGGLPTVDANNRIAGIQGTKNDFDDLNDVSAADVNTQVDIALSDYDAPTKAELDSGLAGLNDLSAAEVNAEVDTALADYDAPTKAELDAGLAGLNDLSAAEVNAEVDAALAEYDGVVPADLPANFSDLAIAPTTGYVTAGTVSDKTGYALTAAYDAAKTAAAAGAQMDLVNAPNATAITAIQSGLAPANEYDVEMARIDDTVSSRAQAGDAMTLNDLGVGKVWDALLTGLITPDSIGKLIVDSLDAAISSRGTADPGDAMTLTSAYDAAKTAAQAGEAAAAIADYDPLTAADVEQAPTNFSSLGITADGRVDVGAVGGTTVTDPDDLKANVSNLDVAVSSRSSHSAADVASAVWAAGSRTLTGFGTLVADVVEGVWAAAQRTLTAFGFTPSANVTQVAGSAVEGVNDFKADVSALALEATVEALNDLSSADAQAAATAALNAYDPPTKAELDAAEGNIRGTDGDTLKTLSDKIAEGGGGGGDATAENQQAIIDSLTEAKGAGFDTATDSLEALRDRGDSGAWSGSAGSGSNTITATASDGAGTLANGVKVTVRDDAGNIVAILSTNSLGVCTFYLDDGTYTIVTGSTSIWQGSSTEVEVTADAAVALTLTAQTLPTPSSADKYIIIINATDEYDDAVGAADRSYRLLRIFPAHDASANLIRSTERNPIVTDAQGRASFEIGRGVEGGVLEESWTDAAGAPRTETHTFAVTADAADDDGRIYLADIIIA